MENFSKQNVIWLGGGNKQPSILEENVRVQKCLFIHPWDIMFAAHGLAFSFDFISQHQSILGGLYNCFTDDLSRQVMLKYIEARIYADAKELERLNVLGESEYFPELMNISDNEIFVDCGAYDGDSIESFLDTVDGKYNKIFAFEADLFNCEEFKKKLMNRKNIILFQKAAWNGKAILHFSDRGNMTSSVNENGSIKIEADSIDNVLGCEEVTFIKMDIEGAELNALKGAEKNIKQNKPKLAICAYHKETDLITLPQYILSLNPDYKLYLRHYGDLCTKLILYAI